MSRAFTAWAPGKVDDEALSFGKEVWGGKGFGLMQMCADKLPVPPGFTISTAVCKVYQVNQQAALAAIAKDLPVWLGGLRDQFGYMPLLSVRSGARVSMPGMMDTVLNVGLTDSNMAEWSTRIGAASAENSYARLKHMFANVVGGLDPKTKGFDEAAALCLPQDPTKQVLECIAAVFNSWQSPRAIEYRKLNNIPDDWGTAVNVQAMVFGNMGEGSGTGVAFTRDPSTGIPVITGEFLANAQGEDVVAGTHKPGPLTDIRKAVSIKAYNELMKLLKLLDAKYGDMQDVEFTIQEGKLWLLQTRSGKRSAAAAFRIVEDLLAEGRITLGEARARVKFADFVLAQRPTLNLAATEKTLGAAHAQGIAGSVGVAIGRAVFNEADVAKYAGEPMVLVRPETTPNDIGMMAKSVGIITATGGFTSHAAVVARGMNIPCVTGISSLTFSYLGATALVTLNGVPIVAGDTLTVDGVSGKVWKGSGLVVADTDGASTRFVQRLAALEGVRLRVNTPTDRAYCIAADTMDLIGWASKAREVQDATLDLRDMSAWAEGADAEFLSNIGQTAKTSLADAVHQLCAVPAAKENVRVILPDEATLAMYDQLKKAGYIPIRAVGTLDEAITAGGEIRLGPQLTTLAGGAKGVAFLRKALAAEGAQFASDDTGVTLVDAARKLLAA